MVLYRSGNDRSQFDRDHRAVWLVRYSGKRRGITLVVTLVMRQHQRSSSPCVWQRFLINNGADNRLAWLR